MKISMAFTISAGTSQLERVGRRASHRELFAVRKVDPVPAVFSVSNRYTWVIECASAGTGSTFLTANNSLRLAHLPTSN
jgi:hypothetical protein